MTFRWLDAHCPPPPATPRLVHGDFRNGNLMIGLDGVRAVLDWELAHIGDPMADLGWICVNSWRFGVADKPVGGFGVREDLWAGYESAGGAPVDRAHARWWEVFGSLRWGVMCAGMIASFRGSDPSVGTRGDRPTLLGDRGRPDESAGRLTDAGPARPHRNSCRRRPIPQGDRGGGDDGPHVVQRPRRRERSRDDDPAARADAFRRG